MKHFLPDTPNKPRLYRALMLRCPYCGQTRLQDKGSWLMFAEGCPDCDYQFSREPGYFWGASWMINYPIISVIVLVGASWTVITYPNIDALLVAFVACAVAVVLGFVLTPFGKAFWLWIDHRIRRP